jgi:hypothetical protein
VALRERAIVATCLSDASVGIAQFHAIARNSEVPAGKSIGGGLMVRDAAHDSLRSSAGPWPRGSSP